MSPGTLRSAEVVFTGCEVPAEKRLGEEGQDLKIAFEALDGRRVSTTETQRMIIARHLLGRGGTARETSSRQAAAKGAR